MTREHRRVTGRRADLTDIRDPASLRRLILEGPGLASLAGIERMTALEQVVLEQTRAPDLALLTVLPRLRTLVVSGPRAVADWRPLERLTTLEHLAVHAVEPADGPALAALDWRRLAALQILSLSAPSGTIALGPLLSLPALGELGVMGFALAEPPLDLLPAAPRLPRSITLPVDRATTQALIQALPPGTEVRGEVDLYPRRG